MSQVLDAPSALDADHPRQVLLGAQANTAWLPVCDHYCGVEARIRKSLQLQAAMQQELGAWVFDVTLDCEDGAPVGGEADHAAMVAELASSAAPGARVAVRVHPVDHAAFDQDIATIVGKAGSRLCHVMVPKVERMADIARAEQALLAAGGQNLVLHALIESPMAVHNAFDIAAHPRVQSLSFGLMDFVSAHAGAIPESAMGVAGQFSHPLVVRAKLAIAAACHAHGKTPSHCVVTEYQDPQALKLAAMRAATEFGYTRMWSIHPDQIRTIVAALAPSPQSVENASKLIAQAYRQHWAPISFNGVLQDRASYRYYWYILERAHQTGCPLPADIAPFFVENY